MSIQLTHPPEVTPDPDDREGVDDTGRHTNDASVDRHAWVDVSMLDDHARFLLGDWQ